MSYSSFPATITSPCPISGAPTCRCSKNGFQQQSILQPTIKDTLRKLYSDQTTYIKCYIRGGANGIDDQQEKQVLIQRLQDNQQDLSEYLKPYIGQENSNKFNSVLKEYTLAITTFIDSLKNKLNIEPGNQKLSQITQQLSQYLNILYPGQTNESIKNELEKQNALITNMALNIVNKDYITETKNYDAYYNNMLNFADKLSQAPKIQQYVVKNDYNDNNKLITQTIGQIGSHYGQKEQQSIQYPNSQQGLDKEVDELKYNKYEMHRLASPILSQVEIKQLNHPINSKDQLHISTQPKTTMQQGGAKNPDFEGKNANYNRYLKYKAKYQALKNNNNNINK